MSIGSILGTALLAAGGGSLFSNRAVSLVAAALVAAMPMVLLEDHAAALHWWQATALVVSTAALNRYWQTADRRPLAVAGAVLGGAASIGAASLIVMPAFAVTIVLLLMVKDNRASDWSRDAAVFGGACAVAALPSVIALTVHPDIYRDRILAYGIYDVHRYNLAQGAREVFSWVGLTARSEIYWHYFDPGWLFLTERLFLLPMAALIPLGVVRVLAEPASPRWLLVAGLVLAPAVAALVGRPQEPVRFVLAAPFAASLAAAGLVGTLRSSRRWQRVAAGMLAGWLVIDAVLFYAR